MKRSLFKLSAALVAMLLVSIAQAQTGSSSAVAQPPKLADVQAFLQEVDADTDLEEAAKNELMSVLRQSEAQLKSAARFREQGKAFRQANQTASTQASTINARLKAVVSEGGESIVEFDKTMVLSELENDLAKDKAQLSIETSRLSEIKEQLQVESTRAKDIRTRQAELKVIADELAAKPAELTEVTGSNMNKALRWSYLASVDANKAETTMLAEELLSQPGRVELLKAQQDEATYNSNQVRERIKAYELYVIKLRQDEAEKAASQAESVAKQAKDKHPLIKEMAKANAELTANSSKVTADLEDIRAQELKARELAKRYEDDLQSIQLKLEIVGMSQALGQVLREQQIRLPRSAAELMSASEREKRISLSGLRQLEYEDERRKISNTRAYLTKLTDGLGEQTINTIEPELRELTFARRDLLTSAIDLEETYLRAMGDLDFTARRLKNSADDYSNFISERLLWIRSSAPVSFSTIPELTREMVRIFNLKQWLQLGVSFVNNAFTSILYLPLLFLVGLMLWGHKRLLKLLDNTGKHVGNVEQDKLRYSFYALGITLVMALRWPLLLIVMGLLAADSDTQPMLGEYASEAFITSAVYFYGFEVLRYLVVPEGLFRRHFLWAESTLQSVAVQLRAVEQVFVPAVVLAIISSRLFHAEGESWFSVLMIIIAMLALLLFFARLPNFMEGRLDTLLIPGARPLSSFWSRVVRGLLIAIPALLIVTMLLGYTSTAVEFLVLLLQTTALFSVVLIANEMGMRWLRLMRQRFIKSAREAADAEQARREAESIEEDEGLVHFEEPDPDVLDSDGRKLLTTILAVSAVIGVWGVWSDVLPALGILNNVELWSQTVTSDGQTKVVPVTLADLGIAALVAFAGYVALQRVPGILEVVLRQKMEMAAGSVYAALTLFRYTLITILTVVVLGILGGSWSQIQWAVAALSVGIGFGLQEIVANFISGLIILFEQPIRVGDTVTVGNTSGVVTKIRMRATTIRDWDRFELLVPNKEFVTGRLLNWSLTDHINRVVIEVGVAYGTNLKDAMELALEAAREHPEVMDDPEPFVTFDEFGDNSLLLVLRCYINSVDVRLTSASQIRLALNDKFNEAGIVVSFPQRDVHLDTSGPLEVSVVPPSGVLPTK